MLNEQKSLEGLLEGEKKLSDRIRTSADPRKRAELEAALKLLQAQIKIKRRSIKKNAK